jgi:hypothetical protein
LDFNQTGYSTSNILNKAENPKILQQLIIGSPLTLGEGLGGRDLKLYVR